MITFLSYFFSKILSQLKRKQNELRLTRMLLPSLSDRLRWLKPVSTLRRDAPIRRTGTTMFYHVLAILWYQMKHELLLNKKQSLLWRNMSPWQRASPVKAPSILSLVADISKSNTVIPIFLFLKSNQKGEMKLSAKLKKFCQADSEPPYFCNFLKVAESAIQNFFKLCRRFHHGLLITFQQ